MLIQYQSKTLNDNVDFSPSPKMYDCIKTQRRFHRAFDLEYCTQSIIDEGLSETLMSFSILSHQVHFVLWGWLYETPSTQPGNKFPSTAKKSRSHSHTHTHTQDIPLPWQLWLVALNMCTQTGGFSTPAYDTTHHQHPPPTTTTSTTLLSVVEGRWLHAFNFAQVLYECLESYPLVNWYETKNETHRTHFPWNSVFLCCFKTRMTRD